MRNALRTVATLTAVLAMLAGTTRQAEAPVSAGTRTPSELALLSALVPPLRADTPDPRPARVPRVYDRSAVNPDLRSPLGKLIEVSIREQRLTAWRDGKIVHRFKVSTARPGYRTPRGHFKILNKARRWWSRQWQVWLPEALRFHGSYFIHGLSYRANPSVRNGASQLGRPASAGCVRVSVAQSKLLYEWAYVGLPVWVH